MTALFATEIELWCVAVIFVSYVAYLAMTTRVRLDVIRGDNQASGFELGKQYSDQQYFQMHKALFKKSWTRLFSKISFRIGLLALIPYAVLDVNDILRNSLLHLASSGR